MDYETGDGYSVVFYKNGDICKISPIKRFSDECYEIDGVSYSWYESENLKSIEERNMGHWVGHWYWYYDIKKKYIRKRIHI